MKKRVVVTGVGAVTPVGNNAQDFWEALISGKSGITPLTQLPNPERFTSRIAGEVKNFDVSLYMDGKSSRRADVFVHFALAGAKMAVEDSSIDISTMDPFRCGVMVGSGIGGLRVTETQHQVLLNKGPSRISPFMIPMLICNIASGMIAIEHGLKGPNTCVVTACATGTHSIGDAFKVIQRGDADVMVAGGSESCITELGLGGFCAMKAVSSRNDDPSGASRPFDKTRDGFVMGEGSGILVLEELEHALNRGADIYCEVVGYGMTCDAYHVTAPDPNATSAARCMRNAIEDSGLKPEEITYVNAHGTSTPLNDVIETQAIKKAFGEDVAKKLMISSTKSMTGHLLGAAGGVEAIATALSIKHDIIHPTINYKTPDPECDLDYVPNEARKVTVNAGLSNSLGFGGHNASIILKKFHA